MVTCSIERASTPQSQQPVAFTLRAVQQSLYLRAVALLRSSSLCLIDTCHLTLKISVSPLRSSIDWKRIDRRSPFGRHSSSPLCITTYVTNIVSIGRVMCDGAPPGRLLQLSACLAPVPSASLPSSRSQHTAAQKRSLSRRERGRTKCDLP